jgi:hypothetical protein
MEWSGYRLAPSFCLKPSFTTQMNYRNQSGGPVKPNIDALTACPYSGAPTHPEKEDLI